MTWQVGNGHSIRCPKADIAEDRNEHIVLVRWNRTVPLDQAVNEIGFFRNQNTVCKPTTPKWRTTVERLKERWPETG